MKKKDGEEGEEWDKEEDTEGEAMRAE